MRSHFIVAVLNASVIAAPLPSPHHVAPSHGAPHHLPPMHGSVHAPVHAVPEHHNHYYGDFDHEAKSNNPSPFWELIPSSLSQAESQVIQLRLEGYNFKEISAKLNYNRSHIKQIFRSAVTKIRETNNE